MTKKEFIEHINAYGWQTVKQNTGGMKGSIIKIDPKKEYKWIKLPRIYDYKKTTPKT